MNLTPEQLAEIDRRDAKRAGEMNPSASQPLRRVVAGIRRRLPPGGKLRARVKDFSRDFRPSRSEQTGIRQVSSGDHSGNATADEKADASHRFRDLSSRIIHATLAADGDRSPDDSRLAATDTLGSAAGGSLPEF
ncbi:MAG: hypothetical protein F9B45_22135 [Phycisphaera sp. RhM]|nr:hypothetical protein [Phycisphaera sp. RhM]